MSDKFVLMCADLNGITIAPEVWGSSNNKLLYVSRMISHLRPVLEDSAEGYWELFKVENFQ